ncbi:MAG: 4a-hydroxytetrahydrobiopterin dehydratase [Betaproteobacteria bacterium]|nr:4a-hydroxytetrahydrobiopterin dehydratase [Betaproteobacteria bacterium]
MSDFAHRHCRPLTKGTAPISDAEVSATLRQFDGWARDKGAITKTFSFPDYHRTLAFVNAVAWIAHREDHHPELQIHYDRCRVSFNTHSIGGISENDFICAARIEELLA